MNHRGKIFDIAQPLPSIATANSISAYNMVNNIASIIEKGARNVIPSYFVEKCDGTFSLHFALVRIFVEIVMHLLLDFFLKCLSLFQCHFYYFPPIVINKRETLQVCVRGSFPR